MTCRRWHELSTTDFAGIDRSKTLVILPLGSIEQHGPHLPVGTDTLIVEAVVESVIQRLKDVDCLFLPVVWATKSNEHRAFAGTVLLSRETLSRVVEDIAGSVAQAGFHKLVFMDAHGGNAGLLDVLGRDIRQSTGLLVFGLELWGFYTMPPLVPGASTPLDIHAGYYETSLILARYPTLMEGRQFSGLGSDRDRGKIAASFGGFKYLLPEGKPVNVPWLTPDYTDDGVIGDPTQASAAVGQLDLDKLVNTVCEVLREVAVFDYRE
jgi:creatinine amidohydrolase